MNKKHTAGFIRQLLLGFAGLLGVLVVLVMVLSLVRIPIDLTHYKGLAESAASDALGRQVSIDGEISVTTSLWPVFEIQGLRIANPDGFPDGDLAFMEQANLRLEILKLLDGRLNVEEFVVSGLALNLISNTQGQVNWIITGPEQASESPEPQEEASQSAGLNADALGLDRLLLENIAVLFRDERDGEELEFVLDRCEGSAPVGEPMAVVMTGELLKEPFTMNVQASSLAEFLAMADSGLDIQIDIAGTSIELSGSTESLADTRKAAASVSITGEQLASLNNLLRADLPPLKNYRVAGNVALEPGRLQLIDAEVALNRQTNPPSATIALSAETIQLDDFDTGNWSAESEESGQEQPEESAEPEVPTDDSSGQAEIMSQETLQRLNALLTVEVGKVLSGTDNLGSGNLKLTLQNGRLSLDPLKLAVPGGDFLMQGSLRPAKSASDASLRVFMQNFDFGALVRRLNPDTDLGGSMNLDIDITTQASSTRHLLARANGYVDLSGNPENLASGVVDLWAVNLLAAVVKSSVEDEVESQVNCLHSRWSMKEGVMRTEAVAVDTSNIRICVEGEIDFKERQFDLKAKPTAKRPEAFSLATPVAVKGSFQEFGVGLDKGLITATTTAVKFVASPITTPFRRLVKEDLPEDGADICLLPIGPHEGDLEDLPGC